MIDKKVLIIVGGAMVGGLALIMLSGSAPARIPGGGGTKKEGATVTETTGEPGAPIYNITFPDPGFPQIPMFDPYAYGGYEGNGREDTGLPPGVLKKVTIMPGLSVPITPSMKGAAQGYSKKEKATSILPEATAFQKIFEPPQIQLLRKIGG